MNRLIKNVLAVIVVSLMCVPIITAGGKKILYIGDSITDGNWGWKGVPTRSTTVTNHVYGHSYMYICTAHYLSEYPEENYQFFNRGTNGNQLPDLQARWQKDVLDINPDVLSILVGINDLNVIHDNGTRFLDTAKFERQYRDIIERSLKQNPNLTIVLGEPFLFPVGIWNSDYPHWRAQCELMASIVRKLSKEYNTIFLPYQSLFDSLATDPKTPSLKYWMWDGIHPTAAGHQKMAEMWIKAVGEKL